MKGTRDKRQRFSKTRDKGEGDLSVTALYTSAVWRWGGLEGAELLATKDADRVFGATNAALAVARVGIRGMKPLRHGLLHRHTMIDHLLREALDEAPETQVLELAAGLSRRGVAFTARPGLRYVEVDLPRVIDKKRELLGRTPAGRDALDRPDWRLLAADVTKARLSELTASDEGPVFVISEGLLMYLDPASQRDLWRRIAELLGPRGGRYVFDLVPSPEEPRPGAVGKSLEWAMKRFTRGKTFERDQRTRDDLQAELYAAGFGAVRRIEPSEVADAWGLPHPQVDTRQLIWVATV